MTDTSKSSNPYARQTTKWHICWRRLALLLALMLLVIGIISGGFQEVWGKAVFLCYECIGIG